MTGSSKGFALQAYLRAQAIWKGLKPNSLRRPARAVNDADSFPFGKGRDPQPLEAVLAASTREMGWGIELSQARLFEEWPRLIGEQTAQHARLLGLRDGMLVAECDSTAWATELRRLRGEILNRILAEYPDAGIRELKFLPPGAPSWRHGPRSVRGRGPRDTYG